MNRYHFILFIVATLFTYSCKNESENEILVVTTEEMQELSEINDVKLFYISIPEIQYESLIENFQNINYQSANFDTEISRLDKSKPVILHCELNTDSKECEKKLEDAGFVKIYDLDSTISKWKFKGFDIKSKP